RELAKRDDHLRLHGIDLTKQERLALLHFVRLGIAVARRSALDHVGDVHVLTSETDGFDDFRQQLPRPTDEWFALDIFVRAWRLADKHQFRVRVADAKDDL